MDYVPVNEPLLNGNELIYLTECIESGWISSEGPFVEKFEATFAKRIGRKRGIAVSNGTAALELSVTALDIGPGDEVIMPSFTIISCASAVTRSGATPVLVDSDPQTWNMLVDQIEDKITSRTRAIMAVHVYGLPVDMDPLLAICKKHDLLLIEDSAESIGLDYKERPCGSFGNISTFSFYANKHVSMGEGGLVAVNENKLAETCSSLRNLCFKNPRFVHDRLGWNMRITNIQAAVGLAQLEQLDNLIDRKRKMGEKYTELLSEVPNILLPTTSLNYADNVYWVYGIILGPEIPFSAAAAMRLLDQRKIGARPFFWPIHKQPVFVKQGMFSNESYPNSENLAQRGLYLPSGAAITGDQIEYVAENVKSILDPTSF